MSNTTTKQLSKTPVYLNVYDLSQDNSLLHNFGFGAYHSGLEINGVEYTFGQGGVVSHEPKGAEMDGQCKFRERILLGETDLSYSQIERHLSKIRDQFAEGTYDLMHRNCNHYTEAVSRALFRKSVQPAWVNRSANLGKKLSFFTGKKAPKSIEIEYDWEAFSGKGKSLRGSDTSSNGSNDSAGKKKTSWFSWGSSSTKKDKSTSSKQITKESVTVTTVTEEVAPSRSKLLEAHEARMKRLSKQAAE